MRQIWTILTGFLLLVSGFSQGAVVEGLYEARVPIAQQSIRVQQQASREAMAQVLVKIKGHKDVLDSQVIKSKLTEAEDYIRQYRFENENGQGYFVANFDAKKIDDLIRAAGFGVWGNRRPSTLVWIAVESPQTQERTLISEQRSSDEALQVLETSRSRGIVVNFPLLDIEDLNRVSVFDVWGRFTDQLWQASERYAVEAMLSARLYQAPVVENENPPAPPQWQADWNSVFQGNQHEGTLTGDSKETLLQAVVQQHADMLASGSIGEPNAQGATLVTLQFNNVADLETYVKVSRILQSLSVVSHVSLKQLSGPVGMFTVRLSGSEEGLINAISLEDRIQRQRDQFGQPMNNLQFNWVEL